MAVIVPVKVVPQSRRQQLVWCEKQQVLRVFVKAAPERGKANEELEHFFCKTLGIRRDQVAIVAGHTGRRKKLSVACFDSLEQVLAACGVLRQQVVG